MCDRHGKSKALAPYLESQLRVKSRPTYPTSALDSVLDNKA